MNPYKNLSEKNQLAITNLEFLFKALGDVNRLRMLALLMDASLCVCELEVLLDMSQSNVSRHLSKLRGAGLIISTKDAQWAHYTFNTAFENGNAELITYLREQFKKHDEVLTAQSRLKKYHKNKLTCKDIGESKEQVIEIIRKGEV